jgi:hypothetical protein
MAESSGALTLVRADAQKARAAQHDVSCHRNMTNTPGHKPSSTAGTPPHPIVVGRTAWDFAAEAIRSRAAILMVTAIFIVMPIAIHFLAEPGSEVNLFLGLIKYKKAMPPPEPAKPQPKEKAVEPVPSSYILPEKMEIGVDAVVPILDGTINVVVFDNPSGPDFVRVGGANVHKIRAAGRTLNGNAVQLVANMPSRTFDAPTDQCVVEIDYLQQIFAVSVQKIQFSRRYQISVRPVQKPTLELKPFSGK